MKDFPSSSELCDGILVVLKNSDRVLHTKEIDSLVSENLNVKPDYLLLIRSGNRTEFAYRMAWAKQRLKQEGKIVNLGKGFWGLKP